MAYRNHTPGGCCCDACFSVTDNFCDMDFSIPPEMQWVDAPARGWTNYQCYAEGTPVAQTFLGLTPTANPPALPGSATDKFIWGLHEWDIEIGDNGLATLTRSPGALIPSLQISRGAGGVLSAWIAYATAFAGFGTPIWWIPVSNSVTLPSGISQASRFRVKLWFTSPGTFTTPPFHRACKAWVAPVDDPDDATLLFFFNAKSDVSGSTCVTNSIWTVTAEPANATVFEHATTTPERGGSTGAIRVHRYKWSANGVRPGCPDLDEHDYMAGMPGYDIGSLKLTLSGCSHAPYNTSYTMPLSGVRRNFISEDKNWNNTATAAGGGDLYHVILRRVEILPMDDNAYLGFRLMIALVFGLAMPLPTNGVNASFLFRHDIATPGQNGLTTSRRLVADAIYVAYGNVPFGSAGLEAAGNVVDNLFGPNATATLSLV